MYEQLFLIVSGIVLLLMLRAVAVCVGVLFEESASDP